MLLKRKTLPKITLKNYFSIYFMFNNCETCYKHVATINGNMIFTLKRIVTIIDHHI